jgi:hypothetical protein
MRTRWKGGIADISVRLSRMIERISTGRDFDHAFQDEFGESAEAFADAFMGFLRSTQNDPKQRLAGTMWQSVDLGAAPARPSQATQESYVGDMAEILGELFR